MLNPNAQKWVDALRSGKYTQGQNRLRSDDGKFCCLGVACDLYVQENPTLAEWCGGTFLTPRDDSRSTLAIEVADWLGMKRDPRAPNLQNRNAAYGSGSAYTNLIVDNDEGSTFAQIADTIEAHQKELFNA